MKAAVFDYQRPTSLDSARQALDALGDKAKLMAGGQTLGPMLNLRLARPAQVLDISALPELRGVTVERGCLRIGAAVTHAEIEDSVHAALRDTPLPAVAAGIAYRAIRNRGTIGGSLAHADPAADWVLTLTALGAEVEIVGTAGKRRVPMAQFMLGAYTTVLGLGDILSTVWVPQPATDARWGHHKFCRKTGEFADASCAALFEPSRGVARLVLGSLDGAPRTLPELAAQIARSGTMPAREQIAAAVQTAAPAKDAIDRQIVSATVERCLKQIFPDQA